MKIPFPPPLSNETRIKLRWRLPIALAVLGGVFLALDLLVDHAFIVPLIASWILSALLFLDAFKVLEEPLLRPRDPAVDQVKRLVKALSESTKVIHEIE